MSLLSKIFSGIFGKSEMENSISKVSEPIEKKKRAYNIKRVTKANQVKNHLLENGEITSWEAIELYGATRLASIIFNLRDSGFNIESIYCSKLDRNSNISNFVNYKLHN
jgi:hypothetical protein